MTTIANAKNNFGRKINLNNAKKALQKEINNKKNEIRNRYARGEFVGRYNNQLRRLENILKNVNRKLSLSKGILHHRI